MTPSLAVWRRLTLIGALLCLGVAIGTLAMPTAHAQLSGSGMTTLTGDVTATGSGSVAATVIKVNGVAFGASPSTNTLPIITAANTATYSAVGDCQDSGGNHLNYNATTHAFSCGTSGGGGGSSLTYTAKTGNYTAVALDYVVATSGTFTVTMPAASSNTDKEIVVANAGSGTITIGRTGSDKVGNQAETSYTLNPGDAFTWHSDGIGTWYIR